MNDIRMKMIALLPRLRGFALALARSSDAADDLVQATCEKALRARDSWKPGTRLDSWMFRIMQNHWIDMRRSQKPQVPIHGDSGELPLSGDDGERIAEARLMLADIRGIIDSMPDEQRAVLLLVCVQDLSYRETAEMLQIPIGTVMSRLARARRMIIDAVNGPRLAPIDVAGEKP